MPKVDVARLAHERAEYLSRARKAEEEVANLRAALKSLELPTEEEPTDAELEREVGWIRAYDPLDLRKAYRLGRAHGYSKGRLDERAEMLSYVEESVKLGARGEDMLCVMMTKGHHVAEYGTTKGGV